MAVMSIAAATRRPGTSSINRALPYAIWIAQAVLALLFVVAGVTKFTMSAEDLTKDIDLSVPFLRFIGACEILGAFGLVLPGLLRIRRGLTPLAASGLVIIMIGAVIVTVPAMGALPALWPLVVGVLAAIVAYSRRSWFTEA